MMANIITMIPEKLLALILKDRKIRSAITKKSFWFFFHVYFARYITYPTADFQKEMLQLAQDENIKRLFIVAFRGSGKSTIITTALPIWAILGAPQTKFVLILTQTKAQAKQHMSNLRQELENNDLLKNDLGPFQEESNEWSAGTLVFSRLNARITVASVEQSIRGLRHGPNRPGLIICDDIEDIASVKTQEGRDKTFQWLTGEVIPAGDKHTRLIVIGNLLHEDSLLKKTGKKIENGEISGVFKMYPLLDDVGKIAWHGKYPTTNDIEEERRSVGDERTWQREYLLRILPTDDQVIHQEWIHYYDRLPSKDASNYRAMFISIDLAISQKDSADYTAMIVLQLHSHGDSIKVYVHPNPINEKLVFPDQQKKIINLAQIHSARVFVESVGYQEALAQSLNSKGILAEGVGVRGDKRERLALISPFLQNGTVLFPSKGCETLIRQLVGFGSEKHDDLADAFSLGIGKIMSNYSQDDTPEVFII